MQDTRQTAAGEFRLEEWTGRDFLLRMPGSEIYSRLSRSKSGWVRGEFVGAHTLQAVSPGFFPFFFLLFQGLIDCRSEVPQ